MRESNISDVSSIQNSNYSSNRKDYEDSIVIQKQVQTIKGKDDEDISFSSFNNSMISVNKSINNQEDSNNSKVIDKQNSIASDDDNKIKLNNKNKKTTKLGNKINYMMLETDTNNNLHLRQDKERSEQKGYTVYEISKIIEDKKHILCYRRYDNFSKFYEALKIRYPHYIIPKLSPKKIMAKVYDDQVFIEQRRKELEFFINEIDSHDVMGKSEELQKFLNGANFDKQYFNSLLKSFDYPETLKKINENKGIITKGMKGVSDIYNYFVGNKTQKDNQRENAKKIFEKTENLDKKLEKYNSIYEEIKIIYKSFIDEREEKKFMINNLLFMKNEGNYENNSVKNKFNELVELNQNYNFQKSDKFLQTFEAKIVDALNFCILYLNGEQKAIKRYKNFLENYNEIINYQKQEKDSNKIDIEQNNIKTDIETYENNLLKEIEKIEDKTNKEYENIIHTLIMSLKDSTGEFVELYENSNFVKE
jgi:hypothetical protein